MDGATTLTPVQPPARPGLTPLLLARALLSPGDSLPGDRDTGTGPRCPGTACGAARDKGMERHVQNLAGVLHRVVLPEMGFVWALSVHGEMGQPHNHGALGSWRVLSSSADPALPCSAGAALDKPWQWVLTFHQDTKITRWGLEHPQDTGIKGLGVSLTARWTEIPEGSW